MGIFDKLKRSKKEDKPKKESVVLTAPKKRKAVAKSASVKTAKATFPKKEIRFAHTVLLAPVVTEKSLKLQATNVYTFYVRNDANKHKVKTAIKEVYGLTPASVRIIKKQPTKLMRWGRQHGVRKASKKAMVTMAAGQSLQLTN